MRVAEQMPNDGRADEACAAGDEDDCLLKAHASEFHVVRFGKRLIYAQEIFAIAAFSATFGEFLEMIKLNITKAQRDFFGTRDAQSLALFQNLNKVARFDERGVGSSVKPGEAASQDFDI